VYCGKCERSCFVKKRMEDRHARNQVELRWQGLVPKVKKNARNVVQFTANISTLQDHLLDARGVSIQKNRKFVVPGSKEAEVSTKCGTKAKQKDSGSPEIVYKD